MDKAIFDWLLSNGGSTIVLLISSGTFGFYIKGLIGRVSSLESSRTEISQTISTLVTKDDLSAAFDKFELRLQGSLAATYVTRMEYERRHGDLSERVTSLNQRLERHEEWHQRDAANRPV